MKRQIKEPQKAHNVYANITLQVMLTIPSDTLSDALSESTGLKVDDFITFNCEHLDSNVTITGVHIV